MKKILAILFALSIAAAKSQTLSGKVAATTMNLWKDSFALDGKPAKWTYDMGVILKSMEDLWYKTGDVKYFNYIQKQVDFFVKDDGSIKTYKFEDFNIDNVCNGRDLMTLYKVTNNEKYWKAASKLREQLKQQPRTKEGGFWHKKIYPNQMWLDGLYMGEPFYVEYADFTNDSAAFSDIANQFIWMEKNSRDAKTGLLYHAYDESKEQKWANKTNGVSPHFWSRAMGWYATALVDVLDYLPENHPKRKELISILNRLVNAVEKQQQKNGLWLDVMNVTDKRNYVEASASCQFVYAIAKGVRKGYIPQIKIAIAKKGYDGIVKQFIKEENGQTNLYGTVKVSGLGGKPYRDGSLDYYFSEPVIVNDPKGLGVFLAAANEMEMLETAKVGKGKVVMLDSYFNNEKKKDITGIEKSWHYKWNEKNNGGFSMFGSVFNRYGATTKTLYEAPTVKNLQGVDVYIIVDPDNINDNPKPNYISWDSSVLPLKKWVEKGGILLLFHNDSGNCEFTKYNFFSEQFGIHFNEISVNKVEGKKFEMGAVYIDSSDEIFKTARKIYLKEISTIRIPSCGSQAFTIDYVLNADKNHFNSKNIMVTSKYGKGTVFAVGDPWLYNEYVDGRKLPVEFENFKAANDLVKWALSQTQKTKVKSKK